MSKEHPMANNHQKETPILSQYKLASFIFCYLYLFYPKNARRLRPLPYKRMFL